MQRKFEGANEVFDDVERRLAQLQQKSNGSEVRQLAGCVLDLMDTLRPDVKGRVLDRREKRLQERAERTGVGQNDKVIPDDAYSV